MRGVKAFTVDTGGTVLDWHSGFATALAQGGAEQGLQRDWHSLANEIRRKSMSLMINHGADGSISRTMDDAHRMALDEVLESHGLDVFSEEQKRYIAYDVPHAFQGWPDVAQALPSLRADRFVVSFTILSYRMIIETARVNGLEWDAVFSCEGIGIYKTQPGPYVAVSQYLQLDPSECCMVACHPFDLDAAKGVGYRTAFVRRPQEWGPDEVAVEPDSNAYDLIVNDFNELAAAVSN
jgi:2-haloacid dehalogenase